MVKQRFVTHFKPWLFAVTKAGGLIVGYQTLDQIRAGLRYSPLDILDVLKGAAIALLTLALFCALWAWGEWCGFKLRAFRRFCSELRRASADHAPSSGISATVVGRMV